MLYVEAKAQYRKLEQQKKDASVALKSFDVFKSNVGLTSDHIKALPEWKEAKSAYEKAASELTTFSVGFNKSFKKEITSDRRKHGYKWLEA